MAPNPDEERDVHSVWQWVVETLRYHPEMALFLTLALGYWIGNVRLGSITLGAVVGVLVAGVVIGQIGITISGDLKTAFFLLFLFSIGYRCGPQFFSGLRASGLPQVVLTIVLCGTGLGTAYALARVFGFDAGTAAGLIAGALTESATVGTGTDALNRLAIDDATRKAMISNVTVAFAVTYFLGVITTITFLSRVAPRILRVDLPAACKALEQEMGVVTEDADAMTGYRMFSARAHRVADSTWSGRSVGEFERSYMDRQYRVHIPRIRRGEQLLEAWPDTQIQKGDVIALGGRREAIMAAAPAVGPEVDDRELLDFPVDVVDVVVTNDALAGRSLDELARRHSGEMARGVGLRRLTRAGVELPFTARTPIARGDVLRLVGHRPDVERVVKDVGYADRPTSVTDMVAVGAALFLGGMIGIPALAVGNLEIGLSQSVGVLLGGLVFGWLRSVNRRFARVPEGALWFFDSVGLTAFLAATALAAGPDFLAGLSRSGLSLVIAGVLLVVIPHLGTLLVGRYIFKMHPGILLGVCCGAGTSAPSLAAVQEVAQSKIPTLGYGVTYAVGNVLLALWGSVIVALLHGA